MWTTWGRSVTSASSRRMPSQTVLSRSHTTHLMDCFSFFLAACTAAAWPWASVSSMTGLLKLLKVEEGDRDLLDLRAPLDDLHHLRVAQVPEDGVLLAHPVGAVDLHGVVGRPDR